MKIKVGVIFGGESVEHEVSIISAIQAINKLDLDKYEVVPIYITKDREWYTGDMLKDIEVYQDFGLIKKYSKLYNKIVSKGKGNVHVFSDIDRFLNDIMYPNEYVNIFSTYVTCENLTPTGIYIADDSEHIELYEMSDYTLLQLVEWLEPIVKIALKGVKLDKHGEIYDEEALNYDEL